MEQPGGQEYPEQPFLPWGDGIWENSAEVSREQKRHTHPKRRMESDTRPS